MSLHELGPAGRILVADDEPDVIDLVRIFFEQQGWRVDGAADGRSALEMARRTPYDAILLDVGMPAMDGHAGASGGLGAGTARARGP